MRISKKFVFYIVKSVESLPALFRATVVSRVLSLNLISFPKNAARRAAGESCAEVFFLKKNKPTSLFPQRSALCSGLYVFPCRFSSFGE